LTPWICSTHAGGGQASTFATLGLTFEKNGKHKSRQDELDYLDIFAFPALFRLKRRRNAKRPYSFLRKTIVIKFCKDY